MSLSYMQVMRFVCRRNGILTQPMGFSHFFLLPTLKVMHKRQDSLRELNNVLCNIPHKHGMGTVLYSWHSKVLRLFETVNLIDWEKLYFLSLFRLEEKKSLWAENHQLPSTKRNMVDWANKTLLSNQCWFPCTEMRYLIQNWFQSTSNLLNTVFPGRVLQAMLR